MLTSMEARRDAMPMAMRCRSMYASARHYAGAAIDAAKIITPYAVV